MGNSAETGRDPTEPTEPQVRIQSFEEKYQESAEDCIREVIRKQRNDPKAEAKPRYKKIHENCQRFSNEDFWIAVDEATDGVIGTVGLRFLKDGVGQFIRLSVRPGFESQGIGSRLIEELMDFAKTNQYKEIYLSTESDEEHTKARGMYERRNFNRLKPNEVPDDIMDLLLSGDDNVEHIKEGKTLIYKLKLEPKQK